MAQTGRRLTEAEYEPLKTLVVAYGASEAARQTGLNKWTVHSLARRRGWKRAHPGEAQASQSALAMTPRSPANPIPKPHNLSTITPSDALANAINSHRSRSTLALGQYAAEAAEQAASVTNKLQIAGKVAKVASVHSTLWPAVEQKQILTLGLLTGQIQVKDSEGDTS